MPILCFARLTAWYLSCVVWSVPSAVVWKPFFFLRLRRLGSGQEGRGKGSTFDDKT
jgi:hypothetical protein